MKEKIKRFFSIACNDTKSREHKWLLIGMVILCVIILAVFSRCGGGEGNGGDGVLDFGGEKADVFETKDIQDEAEVFVETEVKEDVMCVPQGEEKCNGIDDDCNGETDEGLVWQDFNFCLKLGVCEESEPKCLNGEWLCPYVLLSVYEIEEKSCDDKDNDCDGKTDNNASDCKVYYYDADGDGFGSEAFKCLCKPEEKFTVTKTGDCNDENKGIFPGAQPNCKNQCSDGKLDDEEECDDGNTNSGDGCDGCKFSPFLIKKTAKDKNIKYLPSSNGFIIAILPRYVGDEEDGILEIEFLQFLNTGEKTKFTWQKETGCRIDPDTLDVVLLDDETFVVAWQCYGVLIDMSCQADCNKEWSNCSASCSPNDIVCNSECHKVYQKCTNSCKTYGDCDKYECIKISIASVTGEELAYYKLEKEKKYYLYPRLMSFSDGSFIVTWFNCPSWDFYSCHKGIFLGQYFDSEKKLVEDKKFEIIADNIDYRVPFLLKLDQNKKHYAAIFTAYVEIEPNVKVSKIFAQVYQNQIFGTDEKITLCQPEQDNCFWGKFGFGAERFFIIYTESTYPGSKIWVKTVGLNGLTASSLLFSIPNGGMLPSKNFVLPILPSGEFLVGWKNNTGESFFQKFNKDFKKISEVIPLEIPSNYTFVHLSLVSEKLVLLTWKANDMGWGKFIKF
jgi:cysteine-rich repeat protein